MNDFVCCRDKVDSDCCDFRQTTCGRRTCCTVFAYENPIKTDRKRTEEKNSNWECGRSRQDGLVCHTLDGLRTKKGKDKGMWSIVHTGVQTLHGRRMLLRVQGGGMNGWTSGRRTKARGIKKQMREETKG